MDLFCPSARRRQTPGFALVTTLIIIAVLAVVVVGFLASTTGERQTSDAFTSKTRAEEAARTAADSAMAILSQVLRDYPDSATAWDATQSKNFDGTFNEGTSLYLHAVPNGSVPNPNPASTTTANDAGGNDPSNSTNGCRTFVLPLVSGVPNGNPVLLSNKASVLPTNTNQTNEALQTYTDLNVRRFAGDVQGAIGSPPGWTSTTPAPTGPKPAQAPWVTITDSNNHVSARYAFWVEDESFRANINQIGDATQRSSTTRIDNTAQPTPSPSGSPRSLQPADMSLPGLLLALNDTTNADTDAPNIADARGAYPGGFFADPLAFAHSVTDTNGAAALDTSISEPLRYVTTTQSSTLNLSRHGTQRVNLDALVPAPAASASPGFTPSPTGTIQNQVDQIAQTIGFHLPNFGQRFYRGTTDTAAATLNSATQVPPGRPLTSAEITARTASNSLIYLYKIATDIRDYIDHSTQPTLIKSDGTVAAFTAEPAAPLGDDGSANTYWAQGKKNAPYIQEVAARYRPIYATSACPAAGVFNYPQGHYDLCIDYYIEFWNMSDRDVYAAPQADATLPHLNNAHVLLFDQQPWSIYGSGGGGFSTDAYTPPAPHNLLPPGTPTDPRNPSRASAEVLEIDLASKVSTFATNSQSIVMDGTHTYTTPDGRALKPLGVVFPAGSVTVITTDPSCFLTSTGSYPGNPNIQADPVPGSYRPQGLSPAPTPLTPANPTTTFLCQNLIQGDRHFVGKIQSPSGGLIPSGGVTLDFGNDSNHFRTEISLVNAFGYLDLARAALAQYGASPYTNTYKYITQNAYYNDWSYVSSLNGNAKDRTMPSGVTTPASIVSELGDPRTNNEQLFITAQTSLSSSGNGDQSRNFASSGTLGYINNVTVRPDGTTSTSYSTTAPASSWPDYFSTGTQGTYAGPGQANAPAVVAAAPLTSIGQLGDVFDPARLPGSGSTINYSRGGGRTLKIGQHDDRYSSDPTGNVSPNNTADSIPASNGWAAWRLTDIFSADPIPPSQLAVQAEPIELPGRINLNGVPRDNGAALRAALNGFNFQPATTSDPLIHGDGHTAAAGYQSLAGQTLNLTAAAGSTQSGLPEIIKAIVARLNPAAGTAPRPFFERGELSELADNGVFLFGASSFVPPPGSSPNTLLVNNTSPVDMNSTFDRGREELFRRLSELICTRGDTFTVYAVGEALVPTPTASTPFKITSTQRMRVTFRLIPVQADGTPFHPAYAADGTPIALDLSSPGAINTRFAKPDHYDLKVLASNAY